MSPIIMTLPYPISANRYWRTRVAGKLAITYVSAEAKAYKQDVAWRVKMAGIKAPIVGRVAIGVQLYPNRPQDWEKRMRRDPLTWDDTVQCIDVDNANKVLFDSLKGVAIDDDKWVRRIIAERMEPDAAGARVVVTITPLVVAVVQPELIA